MSVGSRCKLGLLLAMLAAAGAPPSATAWADGLSLPGISVSILSGNVRLLALDGAGTLQNPFVLLEEITDSGDAILAIAIDQPAFGTPLASPQLIGFALTKQVINRTGEDWRSFSLELEQTLGRSSDYYDGLSFAQAIDANRPFRSDRFAEVADILEPRDVVLFSGGRVAPGEMAAFQVAITHTAPAPNFYLVQRVQSPYARRNKGNSAVDADAAMRRAAADDGRAGSRGMSDAHGGNIRDQDRREPGQPGAGGG